MFPAPRVKDSEWPGQPHATWPIISPWLFCYFSPPLFILPQTYCLLVCLFVCLFCCSSNNTESFQLQGFCICGSLCLECFSPKYAYDFFICFSVCAQSLRRVWLFLTPWTVAHQAPLSMEYFKQGYWSRLPLPTPGDLPDPRIKRKSLASPALASWFLTTALPGRKLFHLL